MNLRTDLCLAVTAIVMLAGCAPTDIAAKPLPAKDAPTGPTAFLQRAYKPYLAGDMPALDAQRVRTLFTAEIVTLWDRDRAEANGEVGRLEFDPLCGCQDIRGFGRLRITPGPTGQQSSTASIRFVNAATAVTLSYTLRREAGEWRIADICNMQKLCLKAILQTP